jgi:predicted outer membrane repeat protein
MAERLATVLFVVLVLLALPQPALAAPPIVVGNGTPASCTEGALRNALTIVETLGGGTIRFRCGRAPVTIPMTETLIIPNETRIDGDGLITLAAVPIGGFFLLPTVVVEVDTSVVLSNLSVNLGFQVLVNNGTLIVSKSSVSGAVQNNIVNRGTLVVVDSKVCCEISDVAGGGIYNIGTFLIRNTTFSNSFGGGIFNGGDGIIINSHFTNNQFPEGFGGAIWNAGRLTVYNSTFTDNSAFSRGGAIANDGTLRLYNSTISGNVAGEGGGIHNTGTLVVHDSTITGNIARRSGGGVFTCCGGTTTLLNTVVTGNTPDDVVP